MRSIENARRSRYVAFAVLIAASLIIWWQPGYSAVKLALSNDAYTHILLVLPVSLLFIYFEHDRVRPDTSTRKWHGCVLLIVALLIRSISALHLSSGLSWNMFGLVLWWLGVIAFCFGVKGIQSLLFPLGFLFLVVPLPEGIVNGLTRFLQHKSAVAASMLFNAAGVPVARQETMLTIPGLYIEVARECSSIRSSTMLVVITLVLAQLFLVTTWRKSLLVLIAIPLSIAKNAVRIFVIAELGTRVDPAYLHGRLHHDGGIVFLLLALMVVVLLLWILRATERPGHVTATAGA